MRPRMHKQTHTLTLTLTLTHRTRWPAARPSPGGGPSRSTVSSPRSARAVARAASGFSNLLSFPSSLLCLLQLSFWRRPPSRSCSRVGGGGGRSTAWPAPDSLSGACAGLAGIEFPTAHTPLLAGSCKSSVPRHHYHCRAARRTWVDTCHLPACFLRREKPAVLEGCTKKPTHWPMARSMGPHSHTRLCSRQNTTPAQHQPFPTLPPRAQNQGLLFPGNDSGTTGDQAGAKLQCPSRTRDGLHPGRRSRHIFNIEMVLEGRGEGGRPGREGGQGGGKRIDPTAVRPTTASPCATIKTALG